MGLRRAQWSRSRNLEACRPSEAAQLGGGDPAGQTSVERPAFFLRHGMSLRAGGDGDGDGDHMLPRRVPCSCPAEFLLSAGFFGPGRPPAPAPEGMPTMARLKMKVFFVSRKRGAPFQYYFGKKTRNYLLPLKKTNSDYLARPLLALVFIFTTRYPVLVLTYLASPLRFFNLHKCPSSGVGRMGNLQIAPPCLPARPPASPPGSPKTLLSRPSLLPRPAPLNPRQCVRFIRFFSSASHRSGAMPGSSK